MTRVSEEITLTSPGPGTRRSLKVHRYGSAGARPKAYLHAALHADEWPGLLTLNHLIGMLDEADADGRIAGEVVLLPFANPIGMAQRFNGYFAGRHAFDGSGNFNRNWPDLTEPAARHLDGKLGNDAEANVVLMREALRAAVGELPCRSEVETLKATLLSLSIDAEIVLDVHCDSIATMHLYAHRSQEDIVMMLAADLDSPVVLLEDEPGGDPFDKCNQAPWIRLRERFELDQTLPIRCFSTTVELRGCNDVNDSMARADAEGLLHFLMRQGVVAGDPPPLGESPCQATPLNGVDVLRSPGTGIIAWHKEIGERVTSGDLMAELVDIEADDPSAARTPIHAQTSGLLFARKQDTLAQPGDQIGKIAGKEPLAHRQTEQLLSP